MPYSVWSTKKCSMLAHIGYQYHKFDPMNVSNGLGKINPQGWITNID